MHWHFVDRHLIMCRPVTFALRVRIPTKYKPCFTSKQNCCGIYFSACSAWRYWFTKSGFTNWKIEVVNNSCLRWMRVFFVFSYCLEWNITYLLIVVPIYTTIRLSCTVHIAICRMLIHSLVGRVGGSQWVIFVYKRADRKWLFFVYVCNSDIYMCIHIHTYIHMYIDTYIRTYVHTWMHTYLHIT